MSNPTADRRYEIKLASGETITVSHDTVLEELRKLHEWYSGEEKDWYVKTYQSPELSCFNPGYEREWIRYRQEAAALEVAIKLLSGEQT